MKKPQTPKKRQPKTKPKKSQGGKANGTGLKFEDHVEGLMIALDIALVTSELAEIYLRNPVSAPRAFYIKNAVFSKRGGGRGRTEFFLYVKDAVETKEFSSDFGFTVYRIECKYQSSPGSVEDKICTTLERLFGMNEQKRSIVVLSGAGCTVSARREIAEKVVSLMHASERGGNEICVFTAQRLDVFFREILGLIPVSEGQAINGRTDRDGVTPQHDQIEMLKRMLSDAKSIYQTTHRALFEEIINPDAYVVVEDDQGKEKPKKNVTPKKILGAQAEMSLQ